jgi:phytol kinase
MALLCTVFAVFILLCLNEALWRRRKVHTELSRKLIHIIVGSFVAFWPFFLGWNEIELLSVAFFVVVLVSKQLHIFQAIHSVQRPTWGELFFALAVGSVAFITHNKWIYLTAILQMSLADGLAAVFGVLYGRKHRYSVFGQTKSIVGTSTFLVVSLATLYVFSQHSGMHISVLFMIGLAVSASLVENCGAYGLDNLLAPLLVAGALRLVT